MQRCDWAKSDLLIEYHDREWGVPLHDDRRLFEFLILEGAQAGLSWETVLKKREQYRSALDGFDFDKIAKYGPKKLAALMQNPGLIRNRLKIASTVSNAQAMLELRREFGSLDAYLWGFVKNAPLQNGWKDLGHVPARTPESDALSRDLKRRGFRFVGSTICYAFMQAVGLVNDHSPSCFRHSEVRELARREGKRSNDSSMDRA